MTSPAPRPRLAVRGLLLIDDRLLLVNAWGGGTSDLLCAPGGGVELHSSLHDNLIREFHEETGLSIAVGAPCLVNEFHAPGHDFHQVDIYFRATITGGDLRADWSDPAGVVNRWRWVTADQMATLRFKPDSLPAVAFGPEGAVLYDPLELIVR